MAPAFIQAATPILGHVSPESFATPAPPASLVSSKDNNLGSPHLLAAQDGHQAATIAVAQYTETIEVVPGTYYTLSTSLRPARASHAVSEAEVNCHAQVSVQDSEANSLASSGDFQYLPNGLSVLTTEFLADADTTTIHVQIDGRCFHDDYSTITIDAMDFSPCESTGEVAHLVARKIDPHRLPSIKKIDPQKLSIRRIDPHRLPSAKKTDPKELSARRIDPHRLPSAKSTDPKELSARRIDPHRLPSAKKTDPKELSARRIDPHRLPSAKTSEPQKEPPK